MSTKRDDFMDIKIECLDCDGKPAKCEVTVSIGEFDGLMVTTCTPFAGSDNVEFTVEAAKRLRDAIDEGIQMLSRRR